jgi:hypothetical protein
MVHMYLQLESEFEERWANREVSGWGENLYHKGMKLTLMSTTQLNNLLSLGYKS